MQSEIFCSMCVYVHFPEEMVYITFIRVSKKYTIQKNGFFYYFYWNMQQRELFPNSGPLYPLPEIVLSALTGFSGYLTLLASDSFSITKRE